VVLYGPWAYCEDTPDRGASPQRIGPVELFTVNVTALETVAV
jgi:hypothetical protein